MRRGHNTKCELPVVSRRRLRTDHNARREAPRDSWVRLASEYWQLATDSRIFPRFPCGILLGSSQNVNGVLFSLACRKVLPSHKYFVLSHLHLSDQGSGLCHGCGCGNLVESSARTVHPGTTAERESATWPASGCPLNPNG